MRRAIIPIIIMSALSGCANHELECAVGKYHSDCLPDTIGYKLEKARERDDDAKCQSYGLPFGSEAYAGCRQNIEAERSLRSMRRNVMGEQIAPSGPIMMPPSPEPLPPPAPPLLAPKTTTCITVDVLTSCQTH